MSIDTEEVETIPMSDAVEVGGDLEAAVEEEHGLLIETRGPDGSVQMIRLVGDNGEQVPEKSTLEKLREAEATAERSRLMARLYESIDEVDAARSHVLATGEEHKDAKKAMEAAMAFHLHLTKQLRGLDQAEKPDPKRYPLLDGKAEIDATFAKPEAIAPLPPDDFPEYLRRKQNETPVAGMGLKKTTLKLLEKLKLETAGAIRRKFDAVIEGGARLESIDGMTDAKLEDIADALAEITNAAQVEWDGLGLEEGVAADEDTF